MSEPTSWLALEAIKAQLETIKIANGYKTDAGSSVTLDGVQIDALKSPKIAVVCGDFTTNEIASTANILNSNIGIVVEVVIPASFKDANRFAHRAVSDLRRCLTTSAKYLPDGARKLTLSTCRILDRPDGSAVIIAQANGTLQITEKTHSTPAS